ncbi:MAG: CHAT domain-containing protein [Pyrinomonadaceae bacterium]
MSYLDFDLKLFSGGQQEYLVEVLHSPLSGRSEPFPLKLPETEIADWRNRSKSKRINSQTTTALGRKLFEALLPASIRTIWDKNEGAAGLQDVLRLRLDIRAPELADVPWEIIHDDRHFLALTPQRSVVRYLYNCVAFPPVARDAPLNVLLAISAPRDAPPLPAINHEVDRICSGLTALQAAGKMGRVDILRRMTLAGLQDQLRQRPYHILHYMGHGAFEQNQGYLILENEQGYARWVKAETLKYFFGGSPLRLLFFNACQTAINSQANSLLGVAHAALVAGLPAVVAMQDTIADQAAAAFAQEFYQALGEGRTLESCMTEGRRAILDRVSMESMSWAIPVLFSNAPGGLLWSAESTKSSKQPETERPIIVERQQVFNCRVRDVIETQTNYYNKPDDEDR